MQGKLAFLLTKRISLMQRQTLSRPSELCSRMHFNARMHNDATSWLQRLLTKHVATSRAMSFLTKTLKPCLALNGDFAAR